MGNLTHDATVEFDIRRFQLLAIAGIAITERVKSIRLCATGSHVTTYRL